MGTYATATIFIGANIPEVKDEDGYCSHDQLDALKEKYDCDDWEDIYLKKVGFDVDAPGTDAYYKERHKLLEKSGCEIGLSYYEDSGSSPYIYYSDKEYIIECTEIYRINPEDWIITSAMKEKIKAFADFMELQIGEIGLHVEMSYG